METLLGRKFVNNKNEEIVEDVFNVKLISLFFTASWCSPCEIFARDLIEIYNETNQGEKVLEIIQISFEKNEESFKRGIANKPWIFIPYNDSKNAELCEIFKVLGVPIFFVLKKDGTILIENGRKEISKEGVKIIDTWLKLVE
jgi:nucleoredoxin